MMICGTAGDSFRSRYAGGRMELRVQGVFSKAMYLQLPDGRLIMLHDETFGLIPFGVGLRTYVELAAKQLTVQAGAAGLLDGGLLTIDGCPVSIRLEARACAPVSAVRPARGALESGAAAWGRRLSGCGKGAVLPLLGLGRPGEENLFARAAQKPLAQLRGALVSDSRADMEAALLGLLGLGPGLTPSLDDFISGLQYTLLFSARNWGLSLAGTPVLTEAVQALAPRRTNPFSACYLLSTACGERFSLLESFLDGQAFLNSGAGEQILRIGASSGADMMCGILDALRLLGSADHATTI